jgi:uncharacterized repeat protein (TIGR01451 family)
LGTVGQRDYYSFTAAAGDAVSLRLLRTAGTMQPQLELYGPAGTRITWDYSYSGSDVRIDRSLSAAGLHTLVVSEYGNDATGSYALTWQKLNAPCGATSLSCGQTKPGTVDAVGRQRFFSFTASAGDALALVMTRTSGGLDPSLELYDTLTRRASQYTSSGSQVTLTYTVVSSGSFLAIASDYGNDETGGFSLKLQKNSNSCPEVLVSAPNGGENVDAGRATLISWTSSSPQGIASHDIVLSTDGGASFPTPVASGLAGGATSFEWSIPGTLRSSTARIRVIANLVAGGQATDDSDSDFVIVESVSQVLRAYEYDSLYQLVGVRHEDGRRATYRYDPVGNRIESGSTPVSCYALSLAGYPAGTGTLSAAPPPNCGGGYVAGTAVQLTANARVGYSFRNWSGGATGSANPTTVTMDADKACTAVFAPTTVVIGTRTMTVSGSFVIGGIVTYSITIANIGTAAQADGAGHELVDVLPTELSLVSASATSGTAAANLPGNSVSWNGSIPAGGWVLVTIGARVKLALGTTISNQAHLYYDADADGTNESSALTDDPALPGADDPTSFAIVPMVMAFYTLTPCRLLDTRGPSGTYGRPALAAGRERTFPLAGLCGIPPTARVLSVNLAVTEPSVAGNLRLYPAGTPLPLVSSINYVAGQTRANNAIATLNGLGELTVFCAQAAGTVHFILDVNGYFE